MEPRQLTLGSDSPEPDVLEEAALIESMKATVEKYLPDFVLAVRESNASDRILLVQQDAFAATYLNDEFLLLGMAIKYAGLHGVAVQIVGENGETF